MSFIGDLFGHRQAPRVNFTPPSFSGGGISASFGGNGYTLDPSAARTAAVGGVAQTFGQQAGALGDLRQQFAPGFSALRQSQLAAFNNNRTQGLGNLRDNLAQRRVLGSSFAQDSLARADQEYNQQQSEMLTKTYLTELGAQQQLIQQQYTAARGAFQTGLDEMNLEAGIASDLTGRASAAMVSAANTQAQLDMQNRQANLGIASGFGRLIGQFIPGLGGLGGGSSGPITLGSSAGPTPFS